MNRVAALLPALLILSIMPLQSAPYEKEWQAVENALRKGLPQTAIEALNPIIAEAVAANDYDMAARAVARKITIQAEIEGNRPEERIIRIDEALKTADPNLRPVLTTLRAWWIWSYYQQNRYRFMQRTATAEAPGGDFQSWDLPRIMKEVRDSFEAALAEADTLKKIRVEDYAEFLTMGTLPPAYRPTLYDVIANEALTFYGSAEQAGVQAQGVFVLQADSPALDPASDFLAWKPESADATSLSLRAAQIFQDLLRFHENDADRTAYLDVDLTRIEWAMAEAAGESAQARGRAALEHFIGASQEHELSVAARHALAETYLSDDPAKADAIAAEGARAFPKSRFAIQCSNLQKQIRQPTISIQAERVWNAAKPEFEIDYKNLTEVYFRLVARDWDAVAQSRRYWNPDRPDPRAAESLIAAKPTRSWKAVLPATNDFRVRTLPLDIPEDIKPGFYFLLASAKEGFGENDNQVSVTAVWVSDLALIVRPNKTCVEGFVLHALTGEPVPGAVVQAWSHTNNGRREVSGETKTDENGLFAFEFKDSRGNIFIRAKAEIGGTLHEISSTDQNSPEWYSPRPESRDSAFFFTDRTLYRPGQTIEYKGILVHADLAKGGYEVIKNRKVTVRFSDSNGKEIATVEHTSNRYGSFSGTFAAPRDRVTGMMRIEVIGGPSGAANISVEEYKRPKFHTEIAPPADPAQLTKAVSVKGTAMTYADVPVDGAKVSWRVTREVRWPIWCRYFFPTTGAQEIAHGSTTTGPDGTYRIEFTANPDPTASRKNNPVFTYMIRADVTDTAGETRSAEKAVRVGYSSLDATLTASEWQTPDRPVELSVGMASLDGEPRDAAGTIRIARLKQPEKVLRPRLKGPAFFARRYSNVQQPVDDPSDPETWESGEVMADLPFQTKEGKAGINHELPAGIYRVALESKDPAGNPVSTRLTIRVIDPSAKRFALKLANEVITEKTSLEPGTTFRAVWGTGDESGRAFIELAHHGKILKSFWTPAEATQQLIELPITNGLRGGFSFRVTRVKNNRAHLTNEIIDIPWSNKKLSLKWEHFTSKLMPGAKETWTAVISGPDAERAAAEMVATLYDASLDQYKPWNWIDTFGVFFREHTSAIAQFQNVLSTLNHVRGGFRSDMQGVMITRTQFPLDLTGRHWNIRSRRGDVFAYSMSGGFDRSAAMGGKDALFMEGEALFGAVAAPAPASTPMSSMEEAKAKRDNSVPGSASEVNVDPAKVSVRKNLQETAFFFPQLVAGPDGAVRVEFTIPEALTTWRFLGFAHDADLRAGLLESETVTSKDLMVQPNPPRFLREGDTVEFTVKLTNKTDRELSGKAQLTFANAEPGNPEPKLGDLLPQPFSLPARESRTLSWRITVPDGCPFLTYKATAATDTVSDGEEGWLPVLSRRILVTESLPLPIRGPATKQFEFTKLLESAKSDTLRHQNLVVQMVSNPSWYAVMALPYLMEYPYECNEQTFNRLYANSLGRHIAKSDPKIHKVFEQWRNTPALDSPLEKNQDLKSLLIEETPWYREAKSESQARRNVGILFEDGRMDAEYERAFNKLREAQYPDGAWPWFPGGQGNDFITLYITCGFARLRHLGAAPNIELALRALNRLDAWIDEEYDDLRRENKNWRQHVPTATEALYLYTRSFFLKDREIPGTSKEAVDFYLGQAKKFWLETGARMTQAHLALALHRFREPEAAKGIMASLKERSVSNEEMGMFWKDANPSWWWNRAPIETQALLIEAFDEVAGDQQAVEDCRVWLLKQKQTQDWKTTKATADAVYALLLRGKDILTRTDLVKVTIGGVDITPKDGIGIGNPVDHNTEAGTGAYEKRFPANEIRPELGKVEVTKKDEGVAWGSVHWQYLEDIAKVTPYEGTPLKLTKRVFTRVNTPQGPKLEPVNGPIAPGDELVVRVELRVDRAMEYIHLKDQRGSGTEPVNVLSTHKFQDGLRYYESTRDTASHFFIEYLPEGTYVFEYPLRVQLRGEYQTGIAEVQCMYAPEFNSHSASVGLNVR